MKKIIFLLILLISVIGIANEIKEGTYNGTNSKKNQNVENRQTENKKWIMKY